MALPVAVAALVAALEGVERFANIPIIERFLIHVAKKTLNKLDDKVVKFLCDVEFEAIPAAAAKAQEYYNELPPVVRDAMKQTPSAITGTDISELAGNGPEPVEP